MVFPSIPVYLDPPNNWNNINQIHHHLVGVSGETDHQLPPPGLAAPRPDQSGMAAAGSVRPGSMSDRARLAKLPQPEQALKCPRCDSSNTKFCYFNNYSLSQPRHFCKTCRRYWTRGGTLRSVPVGGGCRRNNKRSKSSASCSSKSAAGTSSSSSTATGGGGGAGLGAMAAHMAGTPTHLPLMPNSLQHLTDYSTGNLGLSFAGIQPIHDSDYSIGLEQWRLQQTQQFPFLGGVLDPPQPVPPPMQSAAVSALFPFEGDSLPKVSGSSSSLIRQLSLVKMEDNNNNSNGLNLQRQYLGQLHGNEQFWGSIGGGSTSSNGGWSGNLSNFMNSSSSGNIM